MNLKPLHIKTGNRTIYFDSPVIMGILNVTPDSFYQNSRVAGKENIKRRIDEMIAQGADIIDVGGFSTRPGAEIISIEEEWSRVEVALKILNDTPSHSLISLDTFRAEIAERAIVNYNVAIINDISAGRFDNNMIPTVSRLNATYIGMHSLGSIENMHSQTVKKDIMTECIEYFKNLKTVCDKAGINNLIIDPGFGFSKTFKQNYELLGRLNELNILGLPVLVGISRKSMIYKILNITPDESLTATIILNILSLLQNVCMLRVHDVREVVQAVRLLEKIQNSLSV